MSDRRQNSKSIRRLEFHISYECNNHCLFCSETRELEGPEAGYVETEKIFKALEICRIRGYEHLTLTGGEPTGHPDIIPILEKAKSLGYVIYIGTNGSRTADKNFAGELAGWVDEISFSLHGPDANTHDSITGRPGSFEGILSSIRNLAGTDKGKIKGFANIVAIRHNADRLRYTIKLLSGLPFIRQVMISNAAPEGRAEEHYSELNISLDDWPDLAKEIWDASRQAGLTLRFFGIPACILPDPMLSNDLYWTPRTTWEKRGTGQSERLIRTDSLKPDRKRSHLPVCAPCSLAGLCGGIFNMQQMGNMVKEIIRPIQI